MAITQDRRILQMNGSGRDKSLIFEPIILEAKLPPRNYVMKRPQFQTTISTVVARKTESCWKSSTTSMCSMVYDLISRHCHA